MGSRLLLGVDGGASTVRAWRVRIAPTGRLQAPDSPARRALPERAGFRPAPLPRQLAERAAGVLRPVAGEEERARAVLERTLEVICEAAGPPSAPLLLGLCFPGLKDEEGRGVLVLRHGARLPAFVDTLEHRLRGLGYRLAPPAPRLVADGRAAAWGERHAEAGALRDVRNALYVAGGTGVAEALLLEGEVLSTANLRRRFEPAWRRTDAAGVPFEDRCSMAAINARWTRRAPGAPLPVEEAAAAGDAAARGVLRDAARALGELLADRRAAVERETGSPLERIVLGQRTADLFTDPRIARWFTEPLRNRLASPPKDGEDADMPRPHPGPGAARPELLVASTLHAAPAIGAVAIELHRRGTTA